MKKAIYDEDHEKTLGYLVKGSTSWEAQTIFGYIIERSETEEAATKVLQKQGANYLKGTWQYYDKEERDWFPCIIKHATETQVTVIRTNPMGYQEPEIYKLVLLKNPDENSLIKSN